MQENVFDFDIPAVRRRFSRASRGYDAAAVTQRAVREALLQRLELTRLHPALILDAGAGTAAACRQLKRRYPKARVIAIDSALGMMRQAARHRSLWRRFDRLCADSTQLPFADGSVDLIFSNLMLPWVEPDPVLCEWRRVLRPGGLLTLSSCGPDTLRELRSAWAAVDDEAHVHPFIDMHDLGDALVRAGFSAPVLDVEHYTLTYADARSMMRDLKANGALNALRQRRRTLTGARRLTAMRSAYEAMRIDGRLPATIEIIYANAWAPRAPRRAGAAPESSVSLAELTAELRARAKGG